MLTLQLKESKQIIEIVCLFQYFPMKQSLFISVSQATVAIKYRASDRKRIATTALTDWLRKIPIYNYRTFSNKRPLFDKRPLPNKRPPISLSSITSRDTRKSCFYCHFIYNVLGFNYRCIRTGE